MVSTMVLVTLASGWSYRWMETKYLERKIEEKNRQVFKLLSAAATEALIVEDGPVLETLISQSVLSLPDIHSISVENEDGIQLARWKSDNDVAGIQLISFDDEFIFEGESFGNLEVTWDLRRQHREIDDHMRQMQFLVSVVLFTLTIVILIIIHKLAVRHINRINQRVLDLAEGDLSTKITISASEELVRLANSVNSLASAIHLQEKREKELRQHRDHLDELVHVRTADLQKAKDDLEVLATIDSLTQLYNRASIDEAFKNETLLFARNISIFSIILLDIDHFKNINDVYGHQVGDDVLKAVSVLLKDNVRAIDRVGRWGGEEFLIICSGTDAAGAQILAEKLREKISQHKFASAEDMTCSFGVSTAEFKNQMNDILRRADLALYQAKDLGRNRVVFLSGMK